MILAKTVMAFFAAFVWLAGIADNFTQVVQSQLQSASARFEEASVRLCDADNVQPAPPGARGGGANSFYMSPGRTYVLCITLATIVRTAYGMSPYGMDYMTQGAMGPGGRGLFTRFQLKARVEAEQVPAFDLTVQIQRPSAN